MTHFGFTFVHDDIGKSGVGARTGKGNCEVRHLPVRTLAEFSKNTESIR